MALAKGFTARVWFNALLEDGWLRIYHIGRRNVSALEWAKMYLIARHLPVDQIWIAFDSVDEIGAVFINAILSIRAYRKVLISRQLYAAYCSLDVCRLLCSIDYSRLTELTLWVSVPASLDKLQLPGLVPDTVSALRLSVARELDGAESAQWVRAMVRPQRDSLSLDYFTLTDEVISALGAFAGRELVILHTRDAPGAMARLLETLGRCQNLTVLHLAYLPEEFAPAPGAFPELRHFNHEEGEFGQANLLDVAGCREAALFSRAGWRRRWRATALAWACAQRRLQRPVPRTLLLTIYDQVWPGPV